MNGRLVIRPEAETDIEEAYDWYRKQSSETGQRFLNAVSEGLQSIERYPFSYQKVNEEDRRILLKRFPYGLLYRISDEKIIVLACFHLKRNPQSWQERL